MRKGNRMQKFKKYFILITLPLSLVLSGCFGGNRDTPASEQPGGQAVTSEQPSGQTEQQSSPIAQEVSEQTSGQDSNQKGEDEGMSAKLLYQGHASARIETGDGKVIYIDPFAGDGYDLPADLILITHSHFDHTQTDLIKSKNPGCEIITWKEALKGGEHQSFDYGFVKVQAVEAGYNKNHNVKECVGYVLTFADGITVYFSGDTSKTPQMAELGDLDYAFFCCDGVYNMDMSEAIECAKLVGAKHSIPYHMIPADPQNNFDRELAESFDVPGRIILAPGETLELTQN